MSKVLEKNDFTSIETILNKNQSSNEIGLATLFTALLMLPKTADEKKFLTTLKEKPTIPTRLQALLHQDKNFLPDYLIDLLQHKNLSKEKMTEGLNSLISTQTPSSFKAIFLESLRLKEESPLENKLCLEFFYQKTKRIHIKRNLLLDFANPYDGFNRYDPVHLFASLILASCNIPCLFHGNKNQAPKFGITIKKLLNAAQKKSDYSLIETQKALEDPKKNWAYLDQSTFAKELHEQLPLRTAMVKRPLLATIEKFLSPVIAKQTLLITGYTHPAYRHKSIQLIHDLPHQPDFILIRGQEGSSQAPLDRRCPFISLNPDKEINETFIKPENYNIKTEHLIKNKDLSIDFILTEGIKCLDNKEGKLNNLIHYQCMIILKKIGYDLNQSHELIQKSLKSKKTITAWKNL